MANEENTINQDTNSPLTPRMREAFEVRVPDIRAVPEAEFINITVDIQSTVATVLGAMPEIRKLRPEFMKQLPAFDMTAFDGLESCALALGHAHAAYKAATDPPATLIALAERVGKAKEVLLSEVKTLIARELIGSNAIKELNGGIGYKSLAFDVLTLSQVLRNNWATISARTTLKREELDEAENLAENLLTTVGVREQAPAIAAQAVRDRQAAFTLLINTYEDVRAGIGFVRRKEGDADSIAPSLYIGRRYTKRDPEEEENTTNPATVPAVNANASTNQVPTTGVNAAQVSKPDVSLTGPFIS